jgi:tetratricopeptide (TPR) repeat protein
MIRYKSSLLLVCALLAPLLGGAEAGDALSPEALTARGFDRFYNMDYAGAVEDMEKVLAQKPDDPFAVNHLVSVVLIRELYRMGALNTGDYASDSFVGKPRRPASEEAKRRIRELLERAKQLEGKRLAGNDKDVELLYARGVTRGMAATYTGLIERSWFAALRAAMGSRHDHDRVLELDPKYADAKFIAGTHDYVVGSLPWAVKVAAAIVGFGGNKDRGIQELYVAAREGKETSVDAKVLLVLFLRREQRYDEALKLVHDLTSRYPQNLLIALEEGNLQRAAGRYNEAVAAYGKVWEAGKRGQYPHLHYELAAMALGDLRRSGKEYSAAAEAYERVEQVEPVDPEVKQQGLLGAGEMYDAMGRRDLAMKKYEAVVGVDGETERAAKARERMKQAYRP